jgi:hypothetical protein
MNCRDLEELLSAYADGELSSTQREFIEEHLSGCADCRATLAQFETAGHQLASLRETPASPDISKSTLSKIKAVGINAQKDRRRWLRPVTAVAAIMAVIVIMLVAQPWSMESSEAMAASIVRNSPEVQAALNGEEIEEVEVTTKVVDEENNVLMVLVRTEERAIAAEVNLETKKVTEIVRVEVPDFQPGDEQKAIDIASADARVQEVLAQGGKISKVHLLRHIDVAEVTGPDGIVRKEGTVILTALLTIEQDKYDWNILINLQKSEVASIGRSQPSATMMVVDISRFVTRFVAPVLLFLGILLVSGLSFGYQRAKTIAGTASLALGIIGLFMALYSLSSIWWRQVLSVGIPAEGLVIGIACLRQQGRRRWIPVTGIVLGSLALLLILMNAIMLNINNVPGENIIRVIGIAVVIAGIIAYAFKEQIMSIHISERWLRPATVVLAAVVVLIVALVQPWSVSPQSVIAKAYAATEGLLSYRTSSSITYTYKGEVNNQSSEWEYVFPDRAHGSLNLGLETFEFIIIGDKQYVREPDNASGKISIGVSVSGSTHSKEDTLRLLDSLTKIEKLADGSISGVDCLHLLGEIDLQKRAERAKASLDPDYPAYEEAIKSIDEQMMAGRETVEVWIGKEDYLIRQVKHEGQSASEGGSLDTFSALVKYYDFNQTILIEPPLDAEGNLLPGWRLDTNLSKQIFFDCRTHFEITGEDPAHQQINAIVTVTNVAMEAIARNVRVELRNSEVVKDGDESPWIRAMPSNSEPVVLGRGEGETFKASWECDTSHIASDELSELLERTVIRITYITPEGDEAERMYTAGGVVYPSARPPAEPPAD